MGGVRNEKLADRIKVILADTLDRRVKDPRLGMATITDVRLSGDNQHASIFYTVYGDQEAIDATAEALASATGMLRSLVSKQLDIRHAPTLEFYLDGVPESARKIESLLEKAHASDAEVAAQAVDAQYAGDPNPYRQPGDEGEDR